MTYTLEATSPKQLTICLSFANTADWHASPHPEEGITSLRVLIDWEEKKGIFSGKQAGKLRAAAEKDPAGAESVRLKAIAFREAIYRVITAIIRQQIPAEIDISSINGILQQGMARAGLIVSGDHFNWGWGDEEYGFDCLLWPVAHSAIRLLTDDKLLPMIRQCADDRGCGALFLDNTRNHSRRWCSMKGCGNRAKAQRHYRHQHAAASSSRTRRTG
jgi:predicted RNA-binding Zn ribbon-like protein